MGGMENENTWNVFRRGEGEFGVPFVIDDAVDIAVHAGADGVHVGQEDMEVGRARTLLGRDAIVGVSAETVKEAVLAEKNGADYLGVGGRLSDGLEG